MIIVKRYLDERRIGKLRPPILVYGRRKTGKTFFIKSWFKDAIYLFVRRDRSIYYEAKNAQITYDELLRMIDDVGEKTIVVDEFHRLPEEFLEWLHMKAPTNLILVTSTLHLATKVLGKASPILGLFLEFHVDLIDEADILINLAERINDARKLVEYSTYLREPILLRWFGVELVSILKNLKFVVPSLIGEIFSEEEREPSIRYEGILRALSSGKTMLSEIASTLYARQLIDRQDISAIKPYVKTLMEMGLVKRIPEYMSRRNHYFVASPMIDLYYYLDEKYNFSERDLDEKYFFERFPFHVESFFRCLLSKIFGMRPFMISRPELQVDIALADFRKLRVVGEVKWKERIGKEEVREIEEKLGRFKECRKILIVQQSSAVEEEPRTVELWDVERVVEESRAFKFSQD